MVTRVYKHWLPVVFWMAFISIMSTDVGSAEHTSRILEPMVHWINPQASAADFDLVHLLVRKAAHLSEYAVLGLLSFRAFWFSQLPRSLGGSVWAIGCKAWTVAALFAVSDEFHQRFVPGRTPAVGDILIDSLGAAAGLIFLCLSSGAFFPPATKTEVSS